MSLQTAHPNAGKLTVVTEIIAPYRIPVFNRIAERLGENFKVFFMSATCSGRQWEIPYSKIKFNYEVLRGVNLNFRSKRPNPTYWNPGIGAALKRFGPDSIVIGGYHHLSSYLVWRYAKLNSARFFLWCESTVHDQHSNRFWVQKLKRAFIRSCDAYLVPGTASIDYLKSQGATNDFFNAPNSVDDELFGSDSHSEEERSAFRQKFNLPQFVILFVGRLSPEKNIPLALNAIRNVQIKGLQVGFVVLGDGPYRKQYEAQAKQLGVEHIRFLGFQEQEQLPDYYRNSDLLILPSESEPWGLVVNESLGCGLPVLSSKKVGCAPDLIIEGQTGYTCTTISDYEARIVELFHHPDHLVQMRNHCRAHISNFTPEHSATGFLKLINLEPMRTPVALETR